MAGTNAGADTRTMLFTPIGTADPITQLGDGPMLHIVRHYSPDEVVMFLSPMMADIEDKERRFTHAIELLCESLDRPMPEIKRVRSPRKQVHLLDGFIEEFEEALDEAIGKRKHLRILANASSGTPAMEQAVAAIGAFGEYSKYDFQVLQVATPRGDANKKGDRESTDDYDLETLWELDPDREPDSACRITEAALPNFKDRIVRQNVLALVDQYDYAGAYQVTQGSSVSEQALRLIKAARDRLDLSREFEDERAGLNEYLQVLDIKMRQEKWGDFIRSLTPAYMWTAVWVLDRNGLPREAYLASGAKKMLLDQEKVLRDSTLAQDMTTRDGHIHKYLENWMLDNLTRDYCPESYERLHAVRAFEEGSRNDLAHTITKADKQTLEAAGGTTFEKVMNTLFELNGFEPGKYDDLNKQIRSLL